MRYDLSCQMAIGVREYGGGEVQVLLGPLTLIFGSTSRFMGNRYLDLFQWESGRKDLILYVRWQFAVGVRAESSWGDGPREFFFGPFTADTQGFK